MKKRTKSLFMAISLMLALSFGKGFAFARPENVAKAQGSDSENVAEAYETDFDCDFICSDEKDADNYANYGCKELVKYTEEQAKDAGIPKGFSGEVLSVASNKTNRGITLDFSSKKIPTVLVDSITFRVYVGGDGNPTDIYPEVRIPKPNQDGQWTMRYPFANKTDSWQEIVLKSDNDSFFTENVGTEYFNTLSKDGFLNKFELAMRHNGTNATFYIDSIQVGLIPNDGVAPVISYNGANTIEIAKGQELNIEASATDAQEGAVEIEYEWESQEALDENGNPIIGTHTLFLIAKDYFGNEAKQAITVVVAEPDTIPPTLDMRVDTIYAKIGASVLLTFSATDDRGFVTVTKTWSNGALDNREKLTEGTHTLTVTATDASGNKTEKTVTFIVTAEGDSSDVIIDEQDIFTRPEVPEEDSSDKSESDESVSDLENDNDEPSQDQDASKKGCKGELGGVGLLSLVLAAGMVCFKKKTN